MEVQPAGCPLQLFETSLATHCSCSDFSKAASQRQLSQAANSERSGKFGVLMYGIVSPFQAFYS